MTLALVALAPTAARAADKVRFRVTARLERTRDKRVVRQLETMVEDGKTAQVLDGTWNYDHMPRTPRGLLLTIAAKAGVKIHLKVDAEFGQANAEAAGGNNVVVVSSKNQIEDDFDPDHEVAYPWTINGDDYLLYLAVGPAKPN